PRSPLYTLSLHDALPISVTAVEVSRDLAHALIRVSVMGTDAEKAQTLEGLASVARFLRTQLAHELRLRTSPELRFELDRGLEHRSEEHTSELQSPYDLVC